MDLQDLLVFHAMSRVGSLISRRLVETSRGKPFKKTKELEENEKIKRDVQLLHIRGLGVTSKSMYVPVPLLLLL